MGITWRYFKKYEITSDENVITYLDGDSLHLTSWTSATLAELFEQQGVIIPQYDFTDPPDSEELELILPDILAEACETILEQKKELLDHLSSRLREIQNLSYQGYYFVEDKDKFGIEDSERVRYNKAVGSVSHIDPLQ